MAALAADPEVAGIETKARNAVLIDVTTRTMLFEKAPDESIPPASMVKLMTLAVLFKAIADGEVTLETTFPISEHAWRTGGAPSRTSTMFAELGSEVRVEDLIRGIAVQSANDACIAVAEGMAGSESAFAARMDALGKEIGLKNSRFGNPTGLPDEKTRMSVADLAAVALYLIDTYPQFYPIFSETEFTWNNILQRNRNPLFGKDIGADGLKTGYTEAAGYGIVASAVRDGRRLLLVIAGLESPSDREDEALRLLRVGFDEFEDVTLFDMGEEVSSARVYGGSQRYVPLVAKRAVMSAMPLEGREAYRMRMVYNGPVEAPVRQGQRIGALHLYNDKRLVQRTPLFAAEEVGVGQLHQRARDAAGQLLFGWW
ncbi:D-alanyl-D-alanine carboxypeptidase [Breoghania sp. L-A4]|nr:D-alanyl-D-alanine carboxypeptidase [Breoghania sp. L-A4]